MFNLWFKSYLRCSFVALVASPACNALPCLFSFRGPLSPAALPAPRCAALTCRRPGLRALQVVRAAKVENGPKIAIAGITGAVGQEMLK